MDFEVYINSHNISEECSEITVDSPKACNNEQRCSNNDDNLKMTNFLSSRMELMEEEFSVRSDLRSLNLLSRNYPTYRHYAHRMAKINDLKFKNKYCILPEIKGQNLFGCERGRSLDNVDQATLKVSSGRMDTLHQLQSSILRYGSSGENAWLGFTGQKYQHKLVRPGFSARRYLANLARNLNETLVKRLMCEGYLLEKNLFTNNPVMPHIRRRLSDDLSRYPEPYRILKQMLIAPGPLNEFSFIWARKNILKDGPEDTEMSKGDIKILFKKNDMEGKEEFEEIKYSELSGHKKKTILSNLLVKSAMNHALQIKERMMEYNDVTPRKNPFSNVSNIHIPVIKFDMKEAITDLLTKETIQTLSITQMEIPFMEESVNDGFRGKNFRGSRYRGNHPPDTDLKMVETPPTSVFDSGNQLSVVNEEKEPELYIPQNLTLRLNQSNPSKMKRKKKFLKSDVTSSKESDISDQNVSHVFINSSDGGLKSIYAKDREAQGNAFAEMIKKKAEMASTRKDVIQPYGKYKDPASAVIGDIDPTFSFSNWKYDEGHIHQFATDSGYLTKSDAPNPDQGINLQSQHDHSRLVHLLRGQADSVADEVLGRTEGGIDFASDVNVAIRNIIGQTGRTGSQIWNLDVENLANQADYQGVIKDIFKSIFKDELKSLDIDDVEVSPSLMKLLQSGFNLKLEDIEMVMDPLTGKMMAVLKNGVAIPEGIRRTIHAMTSDMSSERNSVPNKEISMECNSVSSKKHVISPLINGVNSLHDRFDIEKVDNEDMLPGDEQHLDIIRSPSGKAVTLQGYLKDNNLVERQGLLYDASGGHYDKDGQYYDKDGILDRSKNMKIEHVTMTPQLRNTPENITLAASLDASENLIRSKAYGVVGTRDTTTNEYYANGTVYGNSEGVNLTSSQDKVIESKESALQDNSERNDLVVENGSHNVSEAKSDNLEGTKLEGSNEILESNNIYNQSSALSKLSKKGEKSSEKIRKISTQEKKGKKKDFIFGRTDESKDTMKHYTRPEQTSVANVKSKKPIDRRNGKKKTGDKVQDETVGQESEKDNLKPEKEDSGDIYFVHDSRDDSKISGKDLTKGSEKSGDEDDLANEFASDEEILCGDGEEARRMKMLKRQERLAQRKADMQRVRKEEELKKKREEEDRRLEAQRLSLEEALKLKLDEERRRKEEEYQLLKEREKAEEQALLDAERRKEYFRLRQIEKERQQKEEYARRREEARIREALEEKKRKEEQEKRDREEAAMLEKLNEEERNEYLKRKAELLEQQRLEEERERLFKEEQARLALEEAKLIAQKQAIERKLADERQRMKIEDEGLKRYLNVTPAFVWSYFEFLNMLGVNADPSILRLQSTERN